MVYGFLRGGGSVFDLTSPTTVIGRDPSCDLVLQSRSVSSRHAVIEFGPDGPILKDLNSKNGTLVNETRVQNATIPLVHGDVIRVGYEISSFRFELEHEPSIGPGGGDPAQLRETNVNYPHKTLRRDGVDRTRPRSAGGASSPLRPPGGSAAPAVFDPYPVAQPGASESFAHAAAPYAGPAVAAAGAQPPPPSSAYGAGAGGYSGAYRAEARHGSPPLTRMPSGLVAAGVAAGSESAVRFEEHLRARAERQEVALARLEAEHRMHVDKELNELKRRLAEEEIRKQQLNTVAQQPAAPPPPPQPRMMVDSGSQISEYPAQESSRPPSGSRITKSYSEGMPVLSVPAVQVASEEVQTEEMQPPVDPRRLELEHALQNAARRQAETETRLGAVQDALQTASSRGAALEHYAKELQQYIVRLSKKVDDQADRIEELSRPDWARTLQQQTAAINALHDQLAVKEEELATLQQQFAQLAAIARNSPVALAEEFHASFVRTSQALQAVRMQLAQMDQRQGAPAHKWTELCEENKRLKARLAAAEAAAASASQRQSQALQQRDARIAAINSHLASVAAGDTQRQEAAHFLIQQLRSEEAAIAQERAQMQQTAFEAAQVRGENDMLKRQLAQLQASASAAEVTRLRDEIEELRAAAGSEELLRLRDAVTALTSKSTKERARGKKLYAELKQARAASVDVDAAVETLSHLLQEKDNYIAELEAVQQSAAAVTQSAEQRAAMAEAQTKRANAAMTAMRRRHARVTQAVRSSKPESAMAGMPLPPQGLFTDSPIMPTGTAPASSAAAAATTSTAQPRFLPAGPAVPAAAGGGGRKRWDRRPSDRFAAAPGDTTTDSEAAALGQHTTAARPHAGPGYDSFADDDASLLQSRSSSPRLGATGLFAAAAAAGARPMTPGRAAVNTAPGMPDLPLPPVTDMAPPTAAMPPPQDFAADAAAGTQAGFTATGFVGSAAEGTGVPAWDQGPTARGLYGGQ